MKAIESSSDARTSSQRILNKEASPAPARPACGRLQCLVEHLAQTRWWVVAVAFHVLLLALSGVVAMVALPYFSRGDASVTVICALPPAPEYDEKPVRDVFPGPVPVDANCEPIESPMVTHELVEFADHSESDLVSDSGTRCLGTAAGVVDTPLGGCGVVSSIGIGGGGSAGAYGRAGTGGRRRLAMSGGGGKASAERERRPYAVDPRVMAAVRWLAQNQAPDGRWDCKAFGGKEHDVAVTGMALLAFLSTGSTETEGPYREQVRRAVTYLKRHQLPDGRLAGAGGDGYAHAIAGMSLAEAAGQGRVSDTIRAAQKAAYWSATLPDAPDAAWRYRGPGGEGDLSVTGWYVLQLDAARANGLRVSDRALEQARAFLGRVSVKENGTEAARYRYKPGGKESPRLDAIGAACDLLLGAGRSPAHGLRALPDARQPDLYYWYYGTLAAFQAGGRPWRQWHGALYRTLASTQRRGGTESGSWDPAGDYADHWGRVGQTALSALCLNVYNRNLPAAPDSTAGLAPAPAPEPKPKALENPQDAADPVANTESYEPIDEATFTKVIGADALSTFAVDVDTASYTNVRRYLNVKRWPPAGAVRVEELVNYFDYDYEAPANGDAFAVHTEINECPWNPAHRLALVALKGREIERAKPEARPPSNLVFLVDVSGSMSDDNKLPLVRQGLRLLVENLDAKDRVAIVTYAGAAGVALESTPCAEKRGILNAINSLGAGGGTNGAQGILTAYELAKKGFIPGGANRVILCTDGDFNIGVTSRDELLDLIKEQAKSNVFLTVLGFGMGNYKDSTLELLADKGNGTYGYIDSFLEAKKVFGNDLDATLVTIAKDVKIQVEFNPAEVAAYRLIGYENRVMAAKDFRDDTKDGGEIGAGHRVTALYELIPFGDSGAAAVREAGPLKYQETAKPNDAARNGDLFTVYLRHKQPEGDAATEREVVVHDAGLGWKDASANLRWASAVAMFGLQLRDSAHKGRTGWDLIRKTAESAKGKDELGYRAEFLELVAKARSLPKP